MCGIKVGGECKSTVDLVLKALYNFTDIWDFVCKKCFNWFTYGKFKWGVYYEY